MADIFSEAKRSQIMASVKSSDTKPEILIRKFLFSSGLRYRINVKTLPGKPDIVLPKYKIVIFIHGCFWHGHKSCKASTLPKSNKNYWTTKIGGNIKRDVTRKRQLKQLGWKVITIWECSLKNRTSTAKAKKKLLKSILST